MLCGVNFEPCPVLLRQPPPEGPAVFNADLNERNDTVMLNERINVGSDGVVRRVEQDDEEDAVVMGPSGLPGDVVARKRLPKTLRVGDWLYFSRMGAYTASIATVASSAVLETSYCYVASTPADTKLIGGPEVGMAVRGYAN